MLTTEQIVDVQRILKNRDYRVALTGVMDTATISAIKAFQKDNKLLVDGIVGSNTWPALHSVKEFSLVRDGDKLVRDDCPNFRVREFACKDGSDKILICLTNVKYLQALRDKYKLSMHINSGYRPEAYNSLKNSKPTSLHVTGYATDFYFEGIRPLAVYMFLTLTHPGGLGRYKTFTHMDSGRRRRWYG